VLHRLLQRSLREDAGRRVLEFQGRSWTAAELEDRACRLAAGLRALGLEAGDRLAVLLPNGPEAVLAYLACFKANVAIVPLDYRHRAAQIDYALGHSGAGAMLVHHDRLAELAAEGVTSGAGRPTLVVVGGPPTAPRERAFESLLEQRAPGTDEAPGTDDDVCVTIYTSGTTARPKGVTLTRAALAAGIHKYLARVPLGSADVALIAAPVTRPLALRSQLLPVLHAGGCVALIEQFSADAFVAALRAAPAKTFLALLPAALRQVVDHPGFASCDFSALRLCICGGDRVPPALQAAFERITGVAVTEQCGASEVGPYAMNPPFGRKKPGAIGLPMYGAQVCLVDDAGLDVPAAATGEIVVRSPMAMDGYWNDTAQTRKVMRDGWVRTGDLGRFDDDGYLWFMGRRKDVIVRGGSNVSPLEVESALCDHPAVAEACVVGVLDPHWGQVVHAFVVLRDGQRTSVDELLAFLRPRLAAYMLPERFEFLARLPVKGAGKVDRELLQLRGLVHPLVAQVEFFRSASAELIRDLVPRLLCREFDAGATIFRHGDGGDAMYFLTRGRVEVAQPGPGAPAVLAEGACFGELAILLDVPRTATVRAVTDVEVYELGRAAVLGLAASYPEFARHLEGARRGYGAPRPS
jgi:long-chain acyl-CoA synthetase